MKLLKINVIHSILASLVIVLYYYNYSTKKIQRKEEYNE